MQPSGALLKLLSTTEAATHLGISKRRVLALISEGRLPALRVGGRFVVREKDLAAYRPLPTGRPKKAG
jgi:excisionase family DNA binding protein